MDADCGCAVRAGLRPDQAELEDVGFLDELCRVELDLFAREAIGAVRDEASSITLPEHARTPNPKPGSM